MLMMNKKSIFLALVGSVEGVALGRTLGPRFVGKFGDLPWLLPFVVVPLLCVAVGVAVFILGRRERLKK